MTEAFHGNPGPDYDELLGQLATARAEKDPTGPSDLYKHPHLYVPSALIC